MTSVKLSRCYIQCFNVEPGFTHAFSLPKSKGTGEFTIVHMDSAFNKEGWFGEFYLEFKEVVWENRIIEQFEELGAGQVHVVTFKHNDGNDSASNALLRVWELAEKTGYRETRGECSSQLMAKAKAKLEQHKDKQVEEKEWDEKTQAVMRATLDGIKDVQEEVQTVKVELGNAEANLTAELHSLKAEFNDTVAKLTAQVATLQADKQALNQENKRINLLRDQLEAKVGRETNTQNKLDIAIEDKELADKKIRELNGIIQAMSEQIKTYQALDVVNRALELSDRVFKTIDDTAERELKRARTD